MNAYLFFPLRRRSQTPRLSCLETQFSKGPPTSQAAFLSRPLSRLVSRLRPFRCRIGKKSDPTNTPPAPDVLRRLDVVNRGFSGYNTSNALSILPQVFAPPSPGGPELRYLVGSPALLGVSE